MTRNEILLAEVRAYETADPAEERHREAFTALLAGADDPFSRAHFVPGHVTASCYILDPGNRLLLHHHRRLGRWLQMGGHVEPGESPETAALREGREESGLDDLEILHYGIFDLDVHAIPAGKGEPDHCHFDVRYLASTRAPGEITIDRGESNELAWVDAARAGTLMQGEESLRVLRKIESFLRSHA